MNVRVAKAVGRLARGFLTFFASAAPEKPANNLRLVRVDFADSTPWKFQILSRPPETGGYSDFFVQKAHPTDPLRVIRAAYFVA